MKAFIVCTLLAIVAVATAEPPSNRYLPPGQSSPFAAGGGFGGGVGHGGSAGYASGGGDALSEPANYEFSYQVKDEFGNDFGHSESRQGDSAKGRYYVLLPDGRLQVVEYTADENGYQPQVKYEDTGAGAAKAGGFGGSGFGGGANGGYRY